MVCQRFTGLLWASLGSLRGLWDVLGDVLGVLGCPLVILGGPWWLLGCPFGVPGGSQWVLRRSQGILGERPNRTENTEGSLGVFGRGSVRPVIILVMCGGPQVQPRGCKCLYFSVLAMCLEVKSF